MAESGALVERLRAAARTAALNAHSPYSGYQVGAVLLDSEGGQFSGCNVESASYSLTQCAERNAICAAVTAGVRKGQIHSLLVYVPGDRALPPCGACRQVMAEMMSADALVVSCCDGDDTIQWRLDELLPNPFLPD